MERTALFVLGQKGGVGKTTWARAALDVLRAAGLTVAAYDADGSVGQLLQFYGARTAQGKLLQPQDPIAGVVPFDLWDPAQRDTIGNVLSTEADVLLFDAPGGALVELGRVFGSHEDLFSYVRDCGWQPVVAIVITHLKKSALSVRATIEALGPSGIRYAVVKNLGATGGDLNAYEYYDASHGRQMLAECGGVEIVLPMIEPLTYARIDARDLSFSAAATAAGGLTPVDQRRVQFFLRDMRTQLAQARLLPVPGAKK